MKRGLIFILITFCCSLMFSQKFEAENGTFNGTKVMNDLSGYSGKGYVKFSSITNSGKVEVSIKVKKDGNYALEMLYALDKDEKNGAVKIEIDDLYLVAQKLPDSKSFTKVLANNTIQLTKGEHLVRFTGIKGNWLLDNFELKEVNEEILAKIKQPDLCNKNPSLEAVKLYNYLCQMRGKGILSGQQIYGANNSEIKTINNVVGKYPAVIGIDLIDFSPSRVAKGANAGRVIYVAKKYWEEGGIVNCCWHWNAPMDLIDKDQPEMRWYDGFRTKATTFDFTKGLKDTESEEYQMMIRDIDAIAKQLKSLKDAKVPVLWRPLHEASGKWFWWGSKGAENYIELYKFLYDRLVNYHQLNNLIWVWNAQDADWYPGDDVVDIISYDYYPMKNQHGTANEYLCKIQAATVQPKLCALSENGSLPNIVKLEKEKSVWSFWCTWNGDFTVTSDGRNYSENYTKLDALKLYYDNPYTITRDEVPDLK